MSIGDPPPFMPWNDALGYLPHLAFPDYYSPSQLCTQCGAPIKDHIVGGPGLYHPTSRAALWFWDEARS